MKVLFRVDGSANVGLGHLMRCLALAQALNKRKAEVHFVVSPSTVPLCRERHDWVGQIHSLEPDLQPLEELQHIKHLVKKLGVTLLVLDGYQFDENYRKAFRQLSAWIACFDDANLPGNLHCDLVINGASKEVKNVYAKTASNAVLCVGPEYRVLRQEFSELSRIPFEHRRSLTLVMGGSDPANLTLPLLRELEKVAFNGPIRVITGAAYPWFKELSNMLQQSPLSVQHLHDCQTMGDAFSHSRLTVSAAGSSQFELACAGSPSLLVMVADNQREASYQGAQQGWCEVIDMRANHELTRLFNTIQTLWEDPNTLEKMSLLAYQHGDGEGAERVVDAFYKMWIEGKGQ